MKPLPVVVTAGSVKEMSTLCTDIVLASLVEALSSSGSTRIGSVTLTDRSKMSRWPVASTAKNTELLGLYHLRATTGVVGVANPVADDFLPPNN